MVAVLEMNIPKIQATTMTERSIHLGLEPTELTAKRAIRLWRPQDSMAQAITEEERLKRSAFPWNSVLPKKFAVFTARNMFTFLDHP